ncbi:MAG: SusD/RagB family nutrient-binding outer membrane lipoprotein [Bacteroidales bacterium]|nr:SusD/RagB family nutrient-binding outer membrane lipoprotein [Bacteroidales bacterium]MBQ2500837.1 SusD/RagB family nutrient-binding outer membrane lipoprotein [Bacteroidales bacterium]MBQ3985148.1 SusD/RagB family nutrient-binding outer membrane lipoprotein [Bacteroidales bacterium]MBQ4168456.1 SusD/RagB family nutrient-binding outer membrane lipoprotein [Bacteroidales bacterium]MBQ4189202.1 SusD/RagB family nutrient-binding outer membrane lipoprotein [Bacteroidales bacterium]
MDKINEDKDSAKDAASKFIIPDLMLRTAQNVIGGDFNTYIGSYVEYWAGTHNQLYQAEKRNAEVRLSSTFNNGWGDIFYLIRNAKLTIDKSKSEVPEAVQARAIAETMLAYILAEATDLFGDIPYTEVGNAWDTPYPNADSQESIYTEVFRLLDDAAATFATNPASVGGQDFIYGGSNTAWIKFINGLKARYTLRLNNRSSNLAKVIEYVDASFSSAAEQASMPYAGTNNQNPLFDFEWSRDGISSCTSMWNKLMERNDPRADRVYWHSNTWAHFDGVDAEGVLAPTGSPTESQGQYLYDVFMFAEKAPVHFLSYHELMFIKAEAQARLGKTAEAKESLKEAIMAAFVNLEISVDAGINAPSVLAYDGIEPITVLKPNESEALAEEYFDDTVEALFDANPLKEVMIQKYIGLWGGNGEAVETYADIRRLKAEGKGDIYGLINPGKFPLRCPYGNDDVTANPNIEKLYTDAGNYVFTENVWWAGGSR